MSGDSGRLARAATHHVDHTGYLMVFWAALFWSTGGFFVRLIPLDAWTLLGWRSLFGIVAILHCCERQQAGVVSQIMEQIRLPKRLGCIAACTANPDQRLTTRAVGPAHFFSRQLQNRLEKANLRLANCELRCVHSDCEPAGAGCDVIAAQSSLTSLVQTSVRVQRQGMRRDDGSPRQNLPNS